MSKGWLVLSPPLDWGDILAEVWLCSGRERSHDEEAGVVVVVEVEVEVVVVVVLVVVAAAAASVVGAGGAS